MFPLIHTIRRVYTGRVARQNNGLYVLRMIVKLAYSSVHMSYSQLCVLLGIQISPLFM